jgi:DNA-binding response OmpR family regulator
MKYKKKILIVEDDILASTYLKELLETEYTIVSRTGKDAIQKTEDLKPDLILMDVLLQDNISGSEAALEISKKNEQIIIIFLTAHTDKEMLEYAQKSHACAYLTKPYRDDEILATIQVVLWNKSYHHTKDYQGTIKLKNDFSFDLKTHTLYKNKKEIPLTPSKNRLIEILSRNIDTAVSYEQIGNFIWGEPREPSTLRSLVYRTKQAIKDDLITNLNGIGYTIKSK